MAASRRETFLVAIYRRLATLYPRPFRDEYETEMVEAARGCASEQQGFAAALWLGAQLIADVFTTAPKEHWYMLKQDLRHAVRVLSKTPAVTLTAILVMAIGIGSACAVFTIVNAILLRPFPFTDPERLGTIDESSAMQHVDRMGPSLPDLYDYRDQSRLIESVAYYDTGGFSITGQGEPERVDGAWVSASLFPTLGVAPLLGRNFTAEEDAPKAMTAVIIGYGVWQHRYGADPNIIGRTLKVNSHPRTIVGVMPPGFRYPGNAGIWGPMAADLKDNARTDHYLQTVCRLRPGATFAQAGAEVRSILRGIQARFPDASDLAVTVTPLRESMAGDYRAWLVRLLAAVGLVLAIACTNIMNLLLARASVRAREVAIRTALGANRRRIIRQLLTESLLLGAIGGVLGVLFAQAAIRSVPRFAPVNLPYWIEFRMDWRVVLFVSAATIGSALLFGLAPAITSSRVQPLTGLNVSRRGVTAGLRARLLRQALVAMQVALSVVLLAAAGLMIRSLVNMARFDLGFRGRDALSYQISLPQARYKDAREREAFLMRVRGRLAAMPGVRNVATTSALPGTAEWWRTTQPDAKGSTQPGELPLVYHVVVSPGYFAAMGMRLENGRDFTDADGPEAPVVIISARVANQVWPGRDPVGKRLRIDPFLPEEGIRTVVGVVSDIRAQGPREQPSPALYVPEAYSPITNTVVVIRTDLPATALAQTARAVMRELDPELPIYAVRSIESAITQRAWPFRFSTYLLACFALIALLLAAVGLAGIMAQVVIERTHEIGVRMALGATAPGVVGMILAGGMAIVGAGAAIGLVVSLAATRLLASELFGVNAHDAPTMAIVVFVLAAAAWIPARRAARVDPAVALRCD